MTGPTAQEIGSVIRYALKGRGNRDSGTLSGYEHATHPDLGRRLSRKRLHLPQAVFQKPFRLMHLQF